DVAETVGDPQRRHSRHHHDASGDRAAAVSRGTISAAGGRRVRHHWLGGPEVASRIRTLQRVSAVRDPEMAVARRHRRHLGGFVSVRAYAGEAACQDGGSRSGRAAVNGRRRRSALNLLRPRRWSEWIAVALIAALVIGGAVSTWWLSRYSLAVHRLARGVGDTVFYSADGQAWFRLDEQRHDVALSEISPVLQKAVIAVEDRRFYYHPGLDPVGIGRAVYRDIRYGGRMEGASTLTQQLARTLFLSNVRTFG